MTLNPLKISLGIAAKIISAIIFLLTIVASVGGKISPHIWAVPSGLVLFFPYLYIATFIIGVYWLCRVKVIPSIVAVIVLVVCFPAAHTAVPLHFKKDATGKNTFTLLTYNVLGYADRQHDSLDYSRTLAYIIEKDADIVCIQESYGLPQGKKNSTLAMQTDSLRSRYPFIFTSGRSAITWLSKYPAVMGTVPDSLKHFASLCSVKIDGTKVDLIGVHLSSYCLSDEEREVVTDIRGIRSAKESISEFRHSIWHKLGVAFKARATDAVQLRDFIDTGHISTDAIICGDFNDVPLSWTYRKIIGSDFHDAYTDTGFGPIITYNAHLFYFHIDQILYRGSLKPLNIEKGKLKSSDHYPLLSTFSIEQ